MRGGGPGIQHRGFFLGTTHDSQAKASKMRRGVGIPPRRLVLRVNRDAGEFAANTEATLKPCAMAVAVGLSCPLRLGVLDSPDYWTHEALASGVRPLSVDELHHMALGFQRERRNEQTKHLLP